MSSDRSPSGALVFAADVGGRVEVVVRCQLTVPDEREVFGSVTWEFPQGVRRANSEVADVVQAHGVLRGLGLGALDPRRRPV
jgi:Ni,Fe-hydrogenase III component G